MAYDQTGAAVGAAGHYAAALTAALIQAGDVKGAESALDMFTDLLRSTFDACEALKAEQPATEAPARPSRGGGRSFNRGSNGGSRRSSGGGDEDPGSVAFRNGLCAGKTIAEVYDLDDIGNGNSGPDYLTWYAANVDNDFMVRRIEKFLAAA